MNTDRRGLQRIENSASNYRSSRDDPDAPEKGDDAINNLRAARVAVSQKFSYHQRMPEISRFFGIIIRMYFDDHDPPHVHVEHQGSKALLDFQGNIVRGGLQSRTALRLVREWIDLRHIELQADWDLARSGRELKKIAPLD